MGGQGGQLGQGVQRGQGETGQERVPDESRKDVAVHSFRKWVTSDIFDMIIVNLDAGSYLRQTSAKALATAEKEKKDKYLQPCLNRRRTFTPMVYSADVIPGMEAILAHVGLAFLIINKLKREYSEMCGFIRERMLLAIVMYNTLLLCGDRDKEAYISQRPDLTDGAVIALLTM